MLQELLRSESQPSSTNSKVTSVHIILPRLLLGTTSSSRSIRRLALASIRLLHKQPGLEPPARAALQDLEEASAAVADLAEADAGAMLRLLATALARAPPAETGKASKSKKRKSGHQPASTP